MEIATEKISTVKALEVRLHQRHLVSSEEYYMTFHMQSGFSQMMNLEPNVDDENLAIVYLYQAKTVNKLEKINPEAMRPASLSQRVML